jgi:hypothetical protein
MAAGEQSRVWAGRSIPPRRDLAALPGWLQLAVSLAVAGALCLIAHFAGVPGQWAPLVFGGGLGLMTALVAGSEPAPREGDVVVEAREDLDGRPPGRE